MIPKIVTESEANKFPPLPSLKKTVTVVVDPELGSLESGKLKVAEPLPEAVEVAAVSLPPFIEKVYVGVEVNGLFVPDVPIAVAVKVTD